MIHVATSHTDDPTWIPIQARYFERFLTEEYRTYALLSGIADTAPYEHLFYYFSRENVCSQAGAWEPSIAHAIKLNLLADMILARAGSDSDLILFLDGDAFPIGDLAAFARTALREYPLLAVQRLENGGDTQPHPCGCITTVGFWRSIRGDWKPGYKWTNSQGEKITDTGGNLLGQLEAGNHRWLPLLRSNAVELHSLWFGVYHDLIYHHGAAFRSPLCRMEARMTHERIFASPRTRIPSATIKKLAVLLTHLSRKFSNLAHRVNCLDPEERAKARQADQNQRLGAEVFEAVVQDPTFYTRFTSRADGVAGDQRQGAEAETRMPVAVEK